MKPNPIPFLLSTFYFLLLLGCASAPHPVTPAEIRIAVKSRLVQTLRDYPDAEPYLEWSARAIRSVVAGESVTGLSPVSIQIAIDQSLARDNWTLQAALSLHDVLGYYDRAYDAKDPTRNRALLMAIAEGITAARQFR